MRNFKLLKGTPLSYTATYNLMAFDHFLNVPSGLGFDMEYTALRSGEVFVETSGHQAQKTISGELVFRSYEDYSDFINFIGDNSQLTLCYKPHAEWWNIAVKVANISKGEKDTNGRLICAITFIAFSTWYKYSSYAAAAIIPVVNSGVPSPFRLRVTGAASSFSWDVTQDGRVIARGIWRGTLAANQYLEINTDPREMGINIYTNEGVFVSNEYQHCDFSTERFFYVPSGASTFNVSKAASLMVVEYAYSV